MRKGKKIEETMKKSTLLQRGFTLIELMVVVAIIGILMAAGILAFTNAQQNARDSRRRADIDAISKAMEQFYDNNSQVYASSLSSVGSYFPSGAAPTDPQGPAYTFTSNSPTTDDWCICATLERTGRGNATTAGASGTCAYGTGSGADYFCASRRQ
jgi:prepilin-type N-terminal cleavage/methylation domain-containing protein